MIVWIYWLIAILTGAFVGSFLNVVAYRGPVMWGLIGDDRRARGSLLAPRSHCPACEKKIESWRLIPVISFALQKGRCAKCSAVIPVRYPIVEISGALIAAGSFYVAGVSSAAFALAIFGWALLALAAIDWETGFLPDMLTLPLIATGIAVNSFAVFAPLADAAIGAGAGYLSFRLIGALFYRLRGVEGLGQGDAKLIAGIGAWGGWIMLPAIIFAAAVITLCFAAPGAIAGRKIKRDTAIPFGPGLCAAGYGALLLQEFLPNGL